MQSLGYRQALEFLSGQKTLDAAIAECQTRTRQYAKRQMTWFRAEGNVVWLDGFGSDEHVLQEAMERSSAFLLHVGQPAQPRLSG